VKHLSLYPLGIPIVVKLLKTLKTVSVYKNKIGLNRKKKTSLSKYKKIEIIPCILSDHNAIKLELNNKNKDKKHANSWKLNNSLLNEQWAIDEIKEEIKKFLEVTENENTTYRNL
jgi:hypothetical protein